MVLTAQPTINTDDMPVAGETYGVAQTAGMDLDDPADDAGPDQFWDYSMLEEATVLNTTYGTVFDVPLQYQFIFNNPLSQSFSNLAIPIGSLFEGLPIPVSEAYNFFRADDEGYFDCGYAAGFNEIPVFAPRNPTDRLFLFPLEYGMEPDTNSSFFEINIPTFISVKSNQTRFNSVDAWGEVETPYGVYDAVRVRSVVNAIDTVFSEALNIDQVFVRPETVEYRWMAPGEGVPVLQINTIDGAVTQVSYKTAVVETGLTETDDYALNAYPNPAKASFRVDLPSNAQLTDMALVSLNGQRIQIDFAQSGRVVEVNTSGLSPGVYRAVFESDQETGACWVVVQR